MAARGRVQERVDKLAAYVRGSLWRVLALHLIALAVLLLPSPIGGGGGGGVGIPHLDKIIHGLGFAGLVWVSWPALRPWFNPWLAYLSWLGFAALTEVLQAQTSYRSGDIWDFAADAIGITLGFAFAPRWVDEKGE